MIANYQKYILHFKRPSGTSRGVLNIKETYILQIHSNSRVGVGECGIFRGLSYDDVPEYEKKLQWLCENIQQDFETIKAQLRYFPSIWIGYEQAMLNLKYGTDIYFPNDFTQGKKGIKINGLIWMGSVDFMKEQIEEKLQQGFACLKLKIGVDWQGERAVLQELRRQFSKDILELRVDANGAFDFKEAHEVLHELAELDIHSIEQPIKAGNREKMFQLCAQTPTPIALDEELIGVVDVEQKKKLLAEIQPQYIILKPSLVGGFSGSDEWISLADKYNIGWWITSALESNIGLSAIAQYTFSKENPMPQGLGTGSLFVNNFDSSLSIRGDELWKTKNP